jgi:hypothetical protein
MRNQEIAKGLRLIAEGFTTLAVAYENAPVVVGVDMASEEGKTVKSTINTTTNEVVKQEVAEPVKEAEEVKEITPVEVKEEAEVTTSFPTEEELNALPYNDLKIKAKELGVKAVGSKKVIIENILALNNSEEVKEEAPTEVEMDKAIEETEVPTEDRGEEIEINEELEDEDGEALPEEEEETTLYDQVALDLEGYSDEELADILSEIGVSPKGRRQALLAKIVQAIEDGKLEWEEDSEENTEDAPQEATEPSKDVPLQDDQEVGEDDFVGTEARKQACYEECDKIEEDIEKGNISMKEIIKFLKEYHNGKYVSQGEDADVEEYMAIQCDLIDDEGVKHELSDPYYVGDDVLCCGKHLKQLNDDFYCEICGTEYEV